MIGEQLNQAKEAKAFDKLVIIDPAKMLGETKMHVSAKLLKKIIAAMPKDFTHYDGKTLAECLNRMA